MKGKEQRWFCLLQACHGRGCASCIIQGCNNMCDSNPIENDIVQFKGSSMERD